MIKESVIDKFLKSFICRRSGNFKGTQIYSGVFRGAIGPWPLPFGNNFVLFTIDKIRKTKFAPPLCVSTSGQQTFAPPLGNPKYATANLGLF